MQTTNEGAHGAESVVRVAIGWRAREVERRSTAQVAFPDDDRSAAILDNGLVALVYADEVHGFALPSGRFMRLNQAAGRVFSVVTTPHAEALTPEEAAALADSIARVLGGAGWRTVTGAGEGTSRAVAEAVSAAESSNGGFGVVDVGAWRISRGAQSWAEVPRHAQPRSNEWNGVEAWVTLRPVGPVRPGEQVRLILQVRVEDGVLSGALTSLMEARRARHGGEMQTLSGWDAQPTEPGGAP